MTDSTRKGPLGLVLGAAAAVLVVVALGLWLAGEGGARPTETAGAAAATIPAAPEAARAEVELVPAPRVEVATPWDEPTTVLWPCRIELDLIQADYLPTEPDAPPIGTGRAARLSGRITGKGDAGVRAEVAFVAGPNAGRVLACDATGAFGAADLYPGLSVVRVTGPDLPGARREVRLRQNSEALLNLSFGLLASVRGRVVTRAGEPVAGARVSFDGRDVYSGPEGTFTIDGVAGGTCLVTVEHPDYASLLKTVSVSAGRDRLVELGESLTLDAPTTITLSTPQPVGGPGPTLVWILPGSHTRQRVDPHGGMPMQPAREPWFERNPIEVPPTGTVEVENVRPETVRILAFRPGAIARDQIVNLRSDAPNHVEIHLKPAPKITGIVRWDGRPIPGVEIALEAPDQVRANLGFLQKGAAYLESEIVPYFPPARQVVRTDAEGRYALSIFGDAEETRYLEARGPSGTWAGRMVKMREQTVDLELRSVELGDSRVVVEMPGRTQGLPMEVLVNGAPQDPYVLAPFADFAVDDLLAGRWRLRVSWHGEELLHERDFRLKGEQVFTVALPIPAVEGQDEEAWRRAGRARPQ